MTKVTIRDVAKNAGVSPTTVSRVLNNRGYISDEMKKKVHDSIEELGFIPNEMARSLFSNKTKLIGLIIPTTSNPFFGELTYHIEKHLSKLDYKLLVCNSINESENEKKYLRMLQENRVDGIIVGSHNIDIEEYEKMPLKMVSVERSLGGSIPTIQSDNYHGGYIATEELINAECQNILCISGDPRLQTPANDREKAYLDCIENHNMMSHVAHIPFTKSNEEKNKRVFEILQSSPKIDGVFAGDDLMASIVINQANKLGIEVPKELKVVGFDGTENIRTILPDLSTVKQPIALLAEKSVEVLLDEIDNKQVPMSTILPVELISNKSSKTI
ncbi:LacI family DNA-binding transcriptional regulator [Vagococcus lutrae]|uniref:LacI family DNA-binding transcriptional regulator n=1 Tax=Vagococcus lutrae TaxID=81947 RepID=UPI00200EFC6A|nr:LacI family DNA-binding transcriptional regulator [Vagococcus lutrae]UQF37542.1 LacI family DNA-binding transcriptional regulator [Vagococcus lutrae]